MLSHTIPEEHVVGMSLIIKWLSQVHLLLKECVHQTDLQDWVNDPVTGILKRFYFYFNNKVTVINDLYRAWVIFSFFCEYSKTYISMILINKCEHKIELFLKRYNFVKQLTMLHGSICYDFAKLSIWPNFQIIWLYIYLIYKKNYLDKVSKCILPHNII